MKNCAIVKDNYTGVSRGFAFVEYNSIHVSKDFRMIDLRKKIFVQRIRY
jgi:hypothetical protein